MTAGQVGLDAHVVVRRGDFDLDLTIRIDPGQVVALLGPNGAGKSTVLAALSGLLPLTDGHVRLGSRVVDEVSSRTWVRPQDRALAVVHQDYLLFPHLTVLENVAFGLRARGVARRSARERAGRWLARVGVADVAGQRPATISGGQAQRVALARALVTEPGLLLLDEPLAALDAGTRVRVRSELGRHLADFEGGTVIVTHDPLDAMVLADRIVVLEAGRVAQEGSPVELARAPRTAYVAELVGLNLLQGGADGTTMTVTDGGIVHTGQSVVGPCFAAFEPSAVALYRSRPEGSPRNVWPGEVVGLEPHADAVRVRVAGRPSLVADVTAAAVAELGLDLGREVWAAVKATEIHVYPR